MTDKFTVSGQIVKNMIYSHTEHLKEAAHRALKDGRFSEAANLAERAARAEAFSKTVNINKSYNFEEYVAEAPFVPGEN